MQTRRSPTFPHFFDLLFISWNAGSWDEEITNILSSEGNTSNRFTNQIIWICNNNLHSKNLPVSTVAPIWSYFGFLWIFFSRIYAKKRMQYIKSGFRWKKTTAEFESVLIWWEIILHLEVFSRIDSLLTFCSLEFLASSSPRLLSRLKKGGGGESYLFCSRPRAKDFISKTAWHGDLQFSNSLRRSCGCNCFFHQFTCSKFLAEAKGMAENGTVL